MIKRDLVKRQPAPADATERVRRPVRTLVEHPFAAQKSPIGLFVRTIGTTRATMQIGMANFAYNVRRLVWQQRRAAFA